MSDRLILRSNRPGLSASARKLADMPGAVRVLYAGRRATRRPGLRGTVRRRALLAGLLSALLALTGCSTTIDGSAAPAGGAGSGDPADSSAPAVELPPVEDIAWEDCTSQVEQALGGPPDRPLSFECGTTEVPADYDDFDGATLELFLLRAVSTAPTRDRLGSLVVNPGGPGGSGVDAALGLSLSLPESLLSSFDIVGFDPRGVGGSTPVSCISDADKDELNAEEPTPRSDEELTEALDNSTEIADGCAERYGDGLGDFNTVYTARDMDRIREALGEEQLTFLGYSYGTTLGSTYAELFPDRVRAFVLDGAVNPDSDDREDAENDAAAFERAFDAFAADCVARACPAAPDPRALVQQLLDSAETTPIPQSAGDDRLATDGLVFTGVLGALYDQGSWVDLGDALAAAAGGDSTGIVDLADSYNQRLDDGSYTNLVDANIAINCADTDQTYGIDEVAEASREWDEQYPIFGAAVAAGLLTCGVWQATRHPLPQRDAAGAAPILVVGTVGDPATPYEGAEVMADNLESGVLLTWEGEGHTAFPKTPCITDAVVSYLVDLTVPAEGTRCPA